MRFDGEDAWLAFGTVGRPHGVKGEVYLHAFNSNAGVPECLTVPIEVRLVGDPPLPPVTILSFRGRAGRFRLHFQGVDTRQAASELANRILWLPRSCFAPLSPGEFFVEDILGWKVETGAAVSLGKVESLYWNGAHDIMRVVQSATEERLIPVVAEFIVHVDRAEKRLVVDLHE